MAFTSIRLRISFVFGVLLALFSTAWPASIHFDFETDDSQGWRVVDGQFGGLIFERRDVRGSQGERLMTTLFTRDGKTDAMTGIVESPVFILEEPELSFLVGGGQHPGTYVALCTCEGEEVREARGKNSVMMRKIEWRLPNLVGQPLFLRVSDQQTGGWGHVTFDDFVAVGSIDWRATKERFASREREIRLNRERSSLTERMGALRWEALHSAIVFLASHYPENFGDGLDLHDEAAKLSQTAQRSLHRLKDADWKEMQSIARHLEQAEAFQRSVLLSHPGLHRGPILYVRRAQYLADHHNTATMFVTGEINTGSFRGGGSLRFVDLSDEGQVHLLVDPGPQGNVRDPDVYFDGSKILFSMRKSREDDYHIYEVRWDGKELTQLTAAPGSADIDPLYLPDDTIAFTSTREPKYCMCNRHIMGNLFRMEEDGANIRQIGKSTLHEGHGCLLPCGRILYDRWEYVDRNFGDAQGLWTVYPDGTNHAVYWGNNTWSPGGVLDARPVPGTHSVVCVFGSCHDRPWGALALVDRRLGIDGRTGVLQTWPRDAVDRMGKDGHPKKGYGFDNFKGVYPKYEDPWPLDEAFFLCSRQTGGSEEMGIYLVDRFGNEILVHRDSPGCFDPMPLAARPRPRPLPRRRDFGEEEGQFYVVDVYEGTHMKGVEPGSVRFLRVVESPEKRFWTHPSWGGQGVHCPAINWHSFENKRILGTVPVEEDGSASFFVPSSRFVYFQLLDEDGKMVQSMRSGTIIQSGEVQGCIGCHEARRMSPGLPERLTTMASAREPSRLDGWYGPPRIFSYMQEVQPVFDRRCMKCHDYGGRGGDKLILAGDRTLSFNASYIDLWSSGITGAIGGGPYDVQEARSWGSHASKLVEVLEKGHQDVELSEEEMDRIVTWIDINAVYYPSYASAFPDHTFGRSPLTPQAEKRLRELSGAKFVSNHGHQHGAQVSFDRPEMSPCLKGLQEKAPAAYQEALEIIREGGGRLQKTRRADMSGFVPCARDQVRQEKYIAGRREEASARKALREGRRHYDPSD